jgi:TPR repeat protein
MRRRVLHWFAKNIISKLADPHAAVRSNLIERPEHQAAIEALDEGNYAAAFNAFHEMAEQGDAAAQHNLGILYETGTGVMRQDGPAEEWYRRAAEQGLHEAQFQLAAILAADAMADQGIRLLTQ